MKRTKASKTPTALALACAAALLASPPGAQAATGPKAAQEFLLDQIVVTATRTPVKEFEANANINVITREDLERNHYADLTEALQTVPGVTVTRYGAGAGYEQSEGILINGSSRIVVLIDGTRANMNGSEFSVFAFGAFKALDTVERIEVLKGSASTLYGSDAKGGVINIITKKAPEKQRTTLSALTGSYDKEQYRLNHEGSSGEYSWILGVQKDKSGDYKDAHNLKIPSHVDADTINLKLHRKIGENSDLTLAYDKYTADYMYSGTNFGLSQRHYGTADNYNWRAIYNTQVADKESNQFALYSQNTNTFYDGWRMDLQTIGFSDQYTKQLNEKNTLIAGVDYYKEKVKDYLDQMGVGYKGKHLSNRSVYLQDLWDLTDQWNLTSGLRYDHHSKAGGEFSPSVTLDYKWTEKTHMYAGYKEYFAAPSQYQYFSPYGNENLQPESGRTYEIGLNHAFDDTLAVRLHAFERKSKDVIAFAYGYPVTPSNPYGGKYVNVDEEKSSGWDIQLNKKFSDAWNAFIGYTHIEVKSQPKDRPESLNRYIPRGEYHIGVNYVQEKFDASLLGHGVIDRKGVGKGEHPAFPCDSYWVWDASLNYKVHPDMKFFLKANNLFDKFYAEHSNVQGGNPDEWYTSPGRNFQVGLQYSF